MTDPIADMLIRIKNAQAVNKETVDIPYSKIKYQIANVFLKEKLIKKIERKFRKTDKILRLTLSYHGKEPGIKGINRISKPGRRVYSAYSKLKSPKGGYGRFILSTSQGLMTEKEARKKKLGGEVICEIW